MNVVPLDPKSHETVQSLLPWYLTHRLEPREQALVERHLAVCPHCRAELDAERRLLQALASLPAGDAAAQGLERLRPQLQARSSFRRRGGCAWRPWRRVLAALAVVAGPVLVLGLWPAYRAQGPAPAEAANVIVKFQPGLSEQDLRQRLPAGAVLVRTTVTGGVLRAVPAARRDEALSQLRADAAVLLAEPLDGGTPP